MAAYDQQNSALAALTVKKVLRVDLGRYSLLLSPAKVQKRQILEYRLKCIIYRRYFFPISFVMNSVRFLQLTFGEGGFEASTYETSVLL